MRVGLDGTPLLGRRTGVGWYTYDLVTALARAHPQDRFRVMPLSWRTAGQAQWPPATNVERVQRFAPARPLWAMWEVVPFPPLEALLRCDVFHAVNYLAPRTWRTPVVVTVHDVYFLYHPEHCDQAVQRMARLLPAVLQRSAAIIAVSQFTADELSTWLPSVADRIVVAPSAAHIRSAQSSDDVTAADQLAGHVGDSAAAQTVLFVGALGPRKNLPLLLDAVVLLRRDGMRPNVVLAGPPTGQFDITTELRRRGLDDGSVRVLGWVPEGTLNGLLRRATVLALPSLYEGFGLPVLEAMAAGTAVVAVRSSAIPEVAGDAAMLVEPAPPAFAAALKAVLRNDVRRSQMESAGRARAKEFTWARTADITHSVYRSVAR